MPSAGFCGQNTRQYCLGYLPAHKGYLSAQRNFLDGRYMVVNAGLLQVFLFEMSFIIDVVENANVRSHAMPRNNAFLLLALLFPFLWISCSDSVGPEILPPELVAPLSSGTFINEELSIAIEVSDPQDLDVELVFDGLPGWLEFLPGPSLLLGTPGSGDAGNYDILVTADNGSQTASAEILITVFDSEARYREFRLREHIVMAHSSITPGLRGVSMAMVDADGELYTAFTGDMGAVLSHLKLDEESMFRIASATKPMTTALVLKLVDDGVIGLDDILLDHYTTPLPNASVMTLRQMLSHTAGVFDHLNSSLFWGHPAFTPTKVWSVDELVQFAVQNGPLFTPGTSYGYSNTAFCVLGTLVEEVTGMELSEAYEQMLFGPMGLERILYDDFSTVSNTIDGLARNHRTYEYHLSAAGAAGAMVASPADVATFGWQFYGGRFVSEELTEQLSVNIGSSLGGQPYGLGTRIWNIGGIPHHGHTGSLMNYRAILMYVPESDIAIAIHTHDTHNNWFNLVDDLFMYVMEHFDQADLPPVARMGEYSHERITRYMELY